MFGSINCWTGSDRVYSFSTTGHSWELVYLSSAVANNQTAHTIVATHRLLSLPMRGGVNTTWTIDSQYTLSHHMHNHNHIHNYYMCTRYTTHTVM